MMPTTKLQISVSQFLMPKEGAGAEECEDAVGVNVEALRFALADGATEAFDSGSWARALVEGWMREDEAPLKVAEFRRWVAEEGRRLHESWEGRKLPWYAEEKARGGSFATFVGLGFEAARGGLRWRALAVGDACLIHSRGGVVRASLPVESHAGFNSTPPLVPSREAGLDAALRHAVTAEGSARAGDVFLLVSDAAAEWFLRLSEARDPLARAFDSRLAASENEALAELLRAERRAGRIKDDDVAAVRIQVSSSEFRVSS